MQHDVDVVERHDGGQTLGEILEQLPKVPMRRDGFRDFQEETQAIPVMNQVLMMQHIVYGHCDLFADFLEKLQVADVVRVLAQARKTHGTQLPHGRRQRDDAERVDAVLLHPLSHLWPARFLRQVRHEDWLLRLPDRTGGRFVERLFMAADKIGRHVGLDRLQPHPISRGVVEREGHKIHLHDTGKTPSKIAKQFVQIAMGGNRFCHFEQSLIALCDSLAGREGVTIHKRLVWPIDQR